MSYKYNIDKTSGQREVGVTHLECERSQNSLLKKRRCIAFHVIKIKTSVGSSTTILQCCIRQEIQNAQGMYLALDAVTKLKIHICIYCVTMLVR